jgi:hypothetical protein
MSLHQTTTSAWNEPSTSDEIGGRPAKVGSASCCEVRQYGAVTRVQESQPQALLVVELAGVHDDDSRRWGLPPTHVDLVVDLVPGPTGGTQLTS